eukprot:6380950-Heterocapsa_arctica.AAC.1
MAPRKRKASPGTLGRLSVGWHLPPARPDAGAALPLHVPGHTGAAARVRPDAAVAALPADDPGHALRRPLP